MTQTARPTPRHDSAARQLQHLGRWLLDAAGQALGFQAPAEHPQPPAVGPQPFSGRASRHGRSGRRHHS